MRKNESPTRYCFGVDEKVVIYSTGEPGIVKDRRYYADLEHDRMKSPDTYLIECRDGRRFWYHGSQLEIDRR